MSKENRPLLAITIGDPAGVGPEITAKALTWDEVYKTCRPLVIGDAGVMRKAIEICQKDLKVNVVERPSDGLYQLGTMDVLDLHNIDVAQLQYGQVSPMCGKAAVEYVRKGIKMAQDGEVDGIVTAPLNKESMNKAGFHYAGHTEILGEATGTKDFAMMLVAGNLRIVHVSTHVSLRQAIERCKKPRVLATIRLAYNACRELGVEKPRIAVAGINPHAGEDRLFGDEDVDEIQPAIEEARKEGIDASGPWPPDTVFWRALKGRFDGVVAQYHDQGHIAAKVAAFEKGVNTTLGLPIIRTSVDHGTFFREAGQGTANEESLIYAIRVAHAQACVRKGYDPCAIA
ncbi:MAG: 4-hydroxythreonine-4-phosphate dehydrogenase PdxA [Chloroflexi bacterium]|nr:4-hydroxythreonine-4-phosphate dehydrogenase PdxA [Chloroflexota bacterium]MCL5110174.1 4-hydroxythreonine-4-phosphate dehydrogenase PdxA [Chloroflexota bacterium]